MLPHYKTDRRSRAGCVRKAGASLQRGLQREAPRRTGSPGPRPRQFAAVRDEIERGLEQAEVKRSLFKVSEEVLSGVWVEMH